MAEALQAFHSSYSWFMHFFCPFCISWGVLISVLLIPGSLSMDNLQPLSSATATMAMQQAMLAAHDDSLDGTEEEEEDEEDEDEMDEEEEEEEELEEEPGGLPAAPGADLGLDHSDSLE